MIQNIGQQPNSFLSHHRIIAASIFSMEIAIFLAFSSSFYRKSIELWRPPYFQWRLPFLRHFPLHFIEKVKMMGEIVHKKIVKKTR